MENIEYKVEWITVEVAHRYLQSNKNNYRRIRAGHVEHLAAQMRAGHWRFTADTIKFDEAGNLIDGQHRLAAIVDSGIPQKFLVVRGLSSDANTALDQNAVRSYGEVLSHLGYEEARLQATVARWVHTMTIPGQEFTTYVESRLKGVNHVLKVLSEQPQITVSSLFVDTVGTVPRGLPAKSVIAALHVHMTAKDPELADRFVTGLILGTELNPTDPTLLVRNYMIANTHLGQRHRAALLIKTWNFLRHRYSGNYLRFRGKGKAREEFPVVL